MRPNICIRRAEPADVPTIARMKMDLAREQGAPEAVRATELDWQRDLFGPGAHFAVLLAECDRDIAGLLIYGEKFYPAWGEPTISIYDVYVTPAYRRRGVGATLLQHLARQAIGNHTLLMELTVHDENPARRFYHQLGFQHLPQCLTYMLTGPALLQLASIASDFASVASDIANSL